VGEVILYSLAAFGAVVLGWISWAFLHWFFVVRRAPRPLPDPIPTHDSYVIAEVSDLVIGKYRDIEIPEWITTTDGKKFIWESIAVEPKPGVFSVGKIGTYIIVAGCLIYREVKQA